MPADIKTIDEIERIKLLIIEECERIKGGDGDDTQLEHIQHFIKNLK